MLWYRSAIRWLSEWPERKSVSTNVGNPNEGQRKSTDRPVNLNPQANAIAHAFDEEFYVYSGEARASGLRPVDHYVEVGEERGAAPSKDFDPVYYGNQYPDVAKTKHNLFWHYIVYGRLEGRSGRSPLSDIVYTDSGIDPAKKTVIVLVHEATKTGAPILGWNISNQLKRTYNVVAIIMREGPLAEAFTDVTAATVKLPAGSTLDGVDGRFLAQKLIAKYRPLYVIANSTATRFLAVQFENFGVPVVALVHEFASDMPPIGTLNELYRKASRLVFPTRIVAEDSQEIYSALRGREIVIRPQGPSIIPPSPVSGATGVNVKKTSPAFKKDDRFTVFGMGTITFRKGVDLFVSTADFLQRELNIRNVRFVWIGHHIPADIRYKNALEVQVKKCGLSGTVEFIDEVDDLEPFFEAADLYFLSSRIDPLPNVAIDAALRGVPILCFENASGFSDILKRDDATRHLVCPFAGVDAAAKAIANVIDDKVNYKAISNGLRAKAKELFDLQAYVETIDAFGRKAADEVDEMPAIAASIADAAIFDAEFCYGDQGRTMTHSEAINRYLNGIRLSLPLARPGTGTFIRRPLVGFNPLIYDLKNPPEAGHFKEPLADYLSKGKPSGPWVHRVIRPSEKRIATSLRVAIHGHFHYPDLLPEFLGTLAVNELRPDLFITSSEDRVDEVRRILEEAGCAAKDVWAVPNRGRDIIPFIRDLPHRVGDSYDVIGHLHGKKSNHVAASVGDRWRTFAWQHLLGNANPMMDVIIEAFGADPKLGLVFPEDPHLNGWDFNKDIATELAERMGIATPLPIHFDFPIGTMFWARPEALRPLFEMPLDPSEIPAEPLPIDGTMLHALERLIPFAVAKTGFTYATTHVPGVNR